MKFRRVGGAVDSVARAVGDVVADDGRLCCFKADGDTVGPGLGGRAVNNAVVEGNADDAAAAG